MLFAIKGACSRLPLGPGQTCPKVRNVMDGTALTSSSGRVAQWAERVCEQHETVVRIHSPAATSSEDRLARCLNVIEWMRIADHPVPRVAIS
jgi:hypothetical protein